MKDVISILQSRVAKRENFITCWLKKGDSSLILQDMVLRQKQDKRILAEIVQLRREAKRYLWLRNNLGNTVSHWICAEGGDELDLQLDWAMGFYKSKS